MIVVPILNSTFAIPKSGWTVEWNDCWSKVPVCWKEVIRHMIKIAFKYGKNAMSVLALLKQHCHFLGSKKNVPLLSKIILQVLFFLNYLGNLRKRLSILDVQSLTIALDELFNICWNSLIYTLLIFVGTKI